MTTLRPERFGPTWRKAELPPVRTDSALVLCGCGVEMEFDWPRGRDAVRCFGCGQRFERPEHFDARGRISWQPPIPKPPSKAPERPRRRFLAWIVLAAIVGAAAIAAWAWTG